MTTSELSGYRSCPLCGRPFPRVGSATRCDGCRRASLDAYEAGEPWEAVVALGGTHAAVYHDVRLEGIRRRGEVAPYRYREHPCASCVTPTRNRALCDDCTRAVPGMVAVGGITATARYFGVNRVTIRRIVEA